MRKPTTTSTVAPVVIDDATASAVAGGHCGQSSPFRAAGCEVAYHWAEAKAKFWEMAEAVAGAD